MRFIAVLIHSIFIIILQNNSWIDVDLSRRRIVHTHVVRSGTAFYQLEVSLGIV